MAREKLTWEEELEREDMKSDRDSDDPFNRGNSGLTDSDYIDWPIEED